MFGTKKEKETIKETAVALGIETQEYHSSKSVIIETTHIADEEITNHRQKLAKITGRYDLAYPPVKLIETLKENGFRWFVKGGDFVAKFNYSACIFTTTETVMGADYCCVRDSLGRDIYYVGDIPEFALDRIAKAKELGLDYFTIHSNQPLPVRFIVSDPVVVGWRYDPLIKKSVNGKWTTQEASVGIVIAAWNNEGELEQI